ncbi:macro domain-containing protein [Promicromonospora sp. CA-289599]|uniref:macro domain-containing protein n=1 Tax=Promicromonospora sp. CA-289599 TaxID=3240014 RepID=UPI003D944886
MTEEPDGVVHALSRAGRRVEVILGDLTAVAADAIVNPSNSYGTMGGGVALAMVHAGGQVIEDEAVRRSPIPLGTAVLTTAGTLPAQWVIHAPTMRNPVAEATERNVRRAMEAALSQCDEHGLVTASFPGMGTGTGGMPYAEAAEIMVAAIDAHAERRYPALIRLVASNDELAAAWVVALSG